MTHYIQHLECSRTAATYPPDQLYNLSPGCAAPLLVRYRLEDIKRRLKCSQLAARTPSMWRYRELMPVAIEEEIVSLGEGWTPLIRFSNLATKYGFRNLFVKNEAHNPTGSFKARGLSAAVTMAKKLGLSVTDEEIQAAVREVAVHEGLLMCPEGAACWAALKRLRDRGEVGLEERVVLFNTASGHKYPEVNAGLLKIED